MLKKEEKNLRFVATTMAGLEEVLLAEITRLGGRNAQRLTRAVSFEGDLGFLYKSSLALRTAIRILIPLKEFRAHGDDDLYKKLKKLPFETLFGLDNTFAVEAVAHSKVFTHNQFIARRVKDAIADRFRELYGKRPNVDPKDPDFQLNLHIREEICTLSVDASGESLHKRGYRTFSHQAPINEVLAAGLIKLSGWEGKDNFYDPMCGSGTLSIEAALMAANIPPGYFRRGGLENRRNPYAFMNWPHFEPELFEKIYESLIAKVKEPGCKIFASDISRESVKSAEQNIKAAKVEDWVKTSVCDFFQLNKEPGPAHVIFNPPYGERISESDVGSLFKKMGDRFKSHWANSRIWLIAPNNENLKKIGLRPSRKITVFNGPLECRFLRFEMYEGSKKSLFEKSAGEA
jgi:putative N6-adenine-specific DNA methylase